MPLLAVLSLLVLGALGVSAGEPGPPRTNEADQGSFTVPVNVFEKGTNRVVALLRGTLTRFEFGMQQLLKTVSVEYYDARGQTNLIALGTNCTYDGRSRIAWSPQALHVLTGDGQLDLCGEGFTWWQTNNDLAISNQVQTIFWKHPSPASPPGSRSAGDRLQILSDRFRYFYESNLIVYSGHIRVSDPRLELTCGTLSIYRSGTGAVERIVAQDQVVILNRFDRSRATADQGIYRVAEQHEEVELTGNPQWGDGLRFGSAQRFVLNLEHQENLLQAFGQAQLKLPRTRDNAGGLLLLPSPALGGVTNTAGGLIEVTAEFLALHLPPTNGPLRRLEAETNVVILDRTRNSRVTADHAVYDEGAVVAFTGSPAWESGGKWVKGGLLSYDVAQQALAVRTNVLVRFPVLDLGASLGSFGTASGQTNLNIATNQFIVIKSDELTYRDTWLRFGPEVHAEYREGGEPAAGTDSRLLGLLNCAVLALQYSDRLERVEATGGFSLEQLPVAQADGRTVDKWLRGRSLSLAFHTNGAIERIVAEGDLTARMTERRLGSGQTNEKHLECDALSVKLLCKSNLVESAVAEHHVVLTQGERVAHADQASYSDLTGFLTLAGHPVIELPEGRITDAQTVVWERSTGKYRITGKFESHWKRLPSATNQVNLRLKR